MYPYGPFHSHPSAPQPGPTHIYYNRGRMFRGPSRLIWFGLGGLATYWYIQSKERRREMIMNSSEGDQASRSSHCGAWGWGHWGDHRREMKDAQLRMEEQQRKFREQFKDFGSFNSDAIVDVAESSLDSVMSSVVALKAKLAEQRAANHAARAASASGKDEPPRLV